MAVAASPEVQRERAALGLYLEGTYRDPVLARARLEELVTSHGPTSAARRIAANPGQLGALRGRTGLLAGPTARRARAEAARVGQAIAPAVARIGAAEAKATTEVCARDAAARAAAQTGVPRLSQAAEAAIGALGAADGPSLGAASRVEAWATLRADVQVAGEVDRFLAAVARRFLGKADREAAGVLSGAQRHTHFLDSPRIAQSLATSDFRFADLRRELTTVFLVLPPNRMDAYSRWLRLLVSEALVNAE